MFTWMFVKRTAERSLATAAEVALAMLGADHLGILDVDWASVGSVSGLAFLAAVLKAMIASQTVGDPASPSFLDDDAGRHAA